MARNINDLVAHLKKYKDAVIIVGPGIKSTKCNYNIEEYNEMYTRKKFVRDNKAFWDFFFEKIYNEESDKDFELIAENISKLEEYTSIVVSQITDYIEVNKIVELHGDQNKFSCERCKVIYTDDYVFSSDEPTTTCEICGKNIRPSALFSGERYNKILFDLITERINEAHTVILIGMDYTEESLIDLVSKYGDNKTFFNSQHAQEEKILISIQTPEEEFDPNEMVFFEFLVKDNILSALKRLNQAF